MDQLLDLFAHHGLLAVFLGVLLEQVGMPTPALPFLLLAGAHGVDDGRFAIEALALAVTATVLAGSVWYGAGRFAGRPVLSLLCRLSMSPDSCVRKSESSFARRGGGTLVIGKFIPGISILAPPMAGALGMRLGTFLAFHGLGALLWAGVGMAAGAVFHREVMDLMAMLGSLGRVALPVLGVLLLAYLASRLWRRWQVGRALARSPRIAPDQLAELMALEPAPIVLDLRLGIGGRPPEGGVPGARHVALGAIPTLALEDWAPDRTIVTYCDCPQDATAARAAHLLAQRGIAARVLQGGAQGWARMKSAVPV